MQVRAARFDEVGDIAQLWTELVSYHTALDDRLPLPLPDGEMRYARFIHQQIDAPDASVWVAVNSLGDLVGYVVCMLIDLVPDTYVQERGGLIADIFVQPSLREQGVGRALYTRALQWFRDQGVRTVEWDVAAQNTDGIAFWQAVGGDVVMLRMQTLLDDESGER